MKVFNICLSIFLVGILGAALCLTPIGLYLEEEIGLALLFKLRGPILPPKQVVIVSIDKSSSEILHLPEDPEKWPRSYYAELIKKLNEQHPAIIAFNLHFGETRDSANDAMLASAMAQHSNIILSNYLKQYSIPSIDRQQLFRYERVIDPIPILEHAALGIAPFPLPKTSSTVNEFWAFKNSAGDIPTFPTTIFQCYLFKQAYPEIRQLLGQISPSLSVKLPENIDRHTLASTLFQTLQKFKTGTAQNHQILEQLDQHLLKANYSQEKKQLLASWLALLKTSDSLYLNHYGRSETITTIPFYQAMVMEILSPDLFRNKIVLIGYSENIEPEKNQGLYTVFSKANNENISPIELAATAVANLVENAWIKPLTLEQQFFLILGWWFLIASVCRFFSYRIAVTLVSLFSITYLALACFKFSTAFIWIPVFIPILLQTPLALMGASISRFMKSKKEHLKTNEIFSRYVPKSVIEKVTTHSSMESMLHFGELMQGVCMATDAGQYTTLSETMNPEELNVLMNRYYGVMFPQVTNHGGIISDVIGDAMLALWAKPVADIQSRKNACQAALNIHKEIDRFNQSQIHQLPTRTGMHYGEMRLGNVGALDHYEYRAVGDSINTATRIEGLNKLLGTTILVSASVIEDLSDFSTREIGIFVLKGKKQPITIFELFESGDIKTDELVSVFVKALKLFQSYQWEEALLAFVEIEQNYPNDGPTLFYIDYLRQQIPYSQQDKCSGSAALIEIR
jgi:adenylate cyclase